MNTMTAIEGPDIPFQENEDVQAKSSGEATSLQFIPEKIVDYKFNEGGQRSYKVRWKDSFLPEDLLALTYQHLINEFWENATCFEKVTEEKENEKAKAGKQVKVVSSRSNAIETQYRTIAPQPLLTNVTAPSSSSVRLDAVHTAQTVDFKDVTENTLQMIEQADALMKTNAVLPKLRNSTNLNSILMNNGVDVNLSNGLQYQEIPANIIAPVLSKYQQAIQQSLGIQQQQLEHDNETGKATFPKHVFSQSRFSGKKTPDFTRTVNQERVACDICQKSLKTKKMLWAHKVAVHFGGNFPCEICGKKCITAAELRRHKTSHSSERRFVCQYCGLAYKRWSHLYQHLRVHEEEKNFRCDVCHLNFKVQSELKDHCFAEHTTGEFVQCSVCKHKLQTPLAVYHHSMKHTGTRDFLCEICGSNFKRKQHLVTHMKTHLTEKKSGDPSMEAYECQACDETFNLKMELKAHCETLHPLLEDETVNCKTCQRKLNLSHSVYLHGLRHCGVRDFKCVDCEQLFKRKAHLLRHRLDRHPDQPRPRKKRTILSESIICSLCRKSFKYKTALIKHMANQHGILPKADGLTSDYGIVYRKNVKKPHQCEECLKRFKTLSSLHKHKFNKHSKGECEELNSTGMIIQNSNNPTDVSMVKEDLNENSPATMVSSALIQPQMNANKNVCQIESPDSVMVSSSASLHTSHLLPLSTNNSARDNNSPLIASSIASPNMSSSEIMLTVESGDQGPSVHPSDLPRVLTLGGETGPIYLLQTSMDSNGAFSNKGEEDLTKIVQVDDLAGHSGNHLGIRQVISLQSSNANPNTFDKGQSSAGYSTNPSPYEIRVDEDPSLQDASDIHLDVNGQISIGQILNQDSISISSIPLESLQALDFSQQSQEQIVVLLNALNSQAMQHM